MEKSIIEVGIKALGYKVVREIGIPKFEKNYHPTIVNSEVIPKKGPIILCGNHLHQLDQYPVICATDRVVHWMAKQEYFKGTYGMFLKATGSIAVDRYGDSNKSTQEALAYLKRGSAIGLFPEGTRNTYEVGRLELLKVFKDLDLIQWQLKEGEISFEDAKIRFKQLNDLYDERKKELDKIKQTLLVERKTTVIEDEELLPLKFGAVSMAQKSGATIVPFGITGDYTSNNDNLIVSFGQPFKAGNRPLEEVNQELRSKILNLVRENRSIKR